MPNAVVGYSSLQFKYTAFSALPEKFEFEKDLVIEVNLTPYMELGCSSEEFNNVVSQNRWKVSLLDGGWCDFFRNDFEAVSLPQINLQLKFAREVGVRRIRLFFGHPKDEIVEINVLSSRISKLLKQNPDISFLFETHDTWSCKSDNLAILGSLVNLPNLGYVIDPANIVKFNLSNDFRTSAVEKYVQHFHFKGLSKQKEYVSFARNEIDLTSHILYFNKILMSREVTSSVEIESGSESTFDDLVASKHRLLSELTSQ